MTSSHKIDGILKDQLQKAFLSPSDLMAQPSGSAKQ